MTALPRADASAVIQDAADADAAALRRELTATLGWSSPLALFPVRHHSPTCAQQLVRFLHAYRPDCVLIEGPALFNDRIGVLADPAHEAPFAIVSVARRRGEILGRSYYPMCDYSPELCALRVARELGAAARFIDLTHGERPADLRDDEEAAGEERLGGAEDDKNLSHSRFTQALIEQSGCRDFDEVWESLFEQAGWDQDPAAWARSVAVYAHLSRAGYTAAEMEADGTLDRERFMAAQIEEARADYRRVAVVTGAFHTVALRGTRPSLLRRGKDTPAIEIFLAPYTFPRLDALLGYESGMSGPQFYQHLWEARAAEDPFAVAARRVLVEASRLARKDGEVLGTADAIAALSFAQQLAAFRGRPRVGRVEVIEAAQACFIKGDATLVGRRATLALTEAMRGTRVGRLGESAGQSPLVQDFHRRLRELRLPVEHGRPQPVELSIYSSDLALARSRFFHQCTLLELGFCARQRGPDLATGEDLHLTVEHWTVQFVPEVEAELMAHAHLGVTVEDVAAALVARACAAAEGRSAALAMQLLRALLMGLHRTVARLVPRLAAAMLADDDVLSLLGAGRLLRTVLKGRERLEASLVEGLPQLARQAFLQGALRLERLAAFGPDRLAEVLEALGALLDVTLTDPSLAPDRDLLVAHALAARDAARGRAPAALGALDGFLLQIGRTDAAAIARALGGFRGRADGVGAYLEGVLAVARQALLGEGALLTALLDLVQTSPWQEFLSWLPSLRRAMTRLSPRETEAVAARAAEILGLSRADAAEMLEAPPEMVARLSAWEDEQVAREQSWAGDDPATRERSPAGDEPATPERSSIGGDE